MRAVTKVNAVQAPKYRNAEADSSHHRGRLTRAEKRARIASDRSAGVLATARTQEELCCNKGSLPGCSRPAWR